VKILIHSHFFSPSVGGIETISKILADQWCRLGHQVIVTTTTNLADQQGHPYTVVVNPKFCEMRRLIRRSDIFFQSNISLRQILPWILSGTPLFIATHIWLEHKKGVNFSPFLKRYFLSFKFVYSIAVSKAIAKHLPCESIHIANAYDDDKFMIKKSIVRQNDLVFLGRFVSDKGADLLVEALAVLKKNGQSCMATLIGAGPEEELLKELIFQRGLQKYVIFKGKMEGLALVEELNRHRFIVVPSRWDEPFGIVALEGLACGCIPIVSNCDGLLEAIGECGYSFRTGEANDLARVIGLLVKDAGLEESLAKKIEIHLKFHNAEVMAERYLEVFMQRVH
jgi:glycogen synthase